MLLLLDIFAMLCYHCNVTITPAWWKSRSRIENW